MATVTMYLNKEIKGKLDDIMAKEKENISRTVQKCIRYYHRRSMMRDAEVSVMNEDVGVVVDVLPVSDVVAVNLDSMI